VEVNRPIHKDLILAVELVYTQCGFQCSAPKAEVEGAEYGAYDFKINGQPVKFRVSKITPTKTGQFVTLWKRKLNGPIEPFHVEDEIAFYIISTRNDQLFGQFIFPKSILHQKGILSDDNKEGKRAVRVYPPWDRTTSVQAQKTQKWQLDYFLDLSGNKPVEIDKMNYFRP
jgi:hypothetical protein